MGSRFRTVREYDFQNNEEHTLQEQAMQQICVLCESIPMSYEDLVHDFTLPIEPDERTDPEKWAETKEVWKFAVNNLEGLIGILVERGHLVRT